MSQPPPRSSQNTAQVNPNQQGTASQNTSNLPQGSNQKLNDLGKSRNLVTGVELNDESTRGDGANIISDRLNYNPKKVVQGPPQIKYEYKTVEVPKYVEMPATDKKASILDNTHAINILAEAEAKVALLIMEGNRLKWLEAQRKSELARIRGTTTQQTTVPATTNRVSQAAPTYSNTQPSRVVQGAPSTTYTTGAPVNTTSYPARTPATTYTTGAPTTTYTTGAPSTTYTTGAPSTTYTTGAPVTRTSNTTRVVQGAPSTTYTTGAPSTTYTTGAPVTRTSGTYTTTGPTTTTGQTYTTTERPSQRYAQTTVAPQQYSTTRIPSNTYTTNPTTTYTQNSGTPILLPAGTSQRPGETVVVRR